MIICLGPFCVPCWPIFFMILRPIWDFLPETWRETMSNFWDTKVYPNVVNPVLSRLPEKVRKFLLFGIRRATGKDKKEEKHCCNADGTCGIAQGDEKEEIPEKEELKNQPSDTNFTDAKPSDEDSTTCEEGSAMRKRRGMKIPQEIVEIESTEQFEKVLALASSDLPVFLDFTATWCKPCQKIKPVFQSLAEEFNQKAVFCMVDTDEVDELAERFGIVSLPTVVRVDGKGEEKSRLKLVTEGGLKDFVAEAFVILK